MKKRFKSNDKLVDYLKSQGRIRTKKVEEAFRKVDRKDFVHKEHEELAYVDRPVPINGVTISAPHIVAEVTELLEIQPGDTVLEIGSGSGYQAAIIGKIASQVIGVELLEDLAKESKAKVPSNVEIRTGNGFEEVQRDEVFSRILFSCTTKTFKEAHKYVKKDGIIVGPLRKDDEQILTKWKSGNTSEHGKVRYVEMQD